MTITGVYIQVTCPTCKYTTQCVAIDNSDGQYRVYCGVCSNQYHDMIILGPYTSEDPTST